MKITEYESEHIILKEIGSRIKQYRISLNLTQTELANKCGTSSSTIVRIENGIDSKITNYIKILNVFGLQQNIELLIPEAQPDFKSLFEKKSVRMRVKSKNSKSNSTWIWEEDK